MGSVEAVSDKSQVRRLAIDYVGVQTAVEWDDHSLDTRLRDLLSLPIWRHDPTLRPASIFRLSRGPSGHQIEGPSQHLSWVEKADVLETLERRLHLFLACETRQAIFVHAGVVEWNGCAVVLPGRSFAGKSTLVEALWRRGARYLSDEYAVIDKDGWVHPFPRPLSLREAGERRRISAADLGWKAELQRRHRAGALIFTSYQPAAVWSPEEISPGTAVLHVLENTVSAQLAPALALPVASRLVEGAYLWAGPRGDAETTASQILSRLAILL